MESISFNVINDISPDCTVTTQDPEYRLFLGTSSSFGTFIPDRFSLVLPLTSWIGFIYFNSTGKDIGNIFRQRCSDDRQISQDPFSFYSDSQGYIQTALFKEKPSDDFFPLIPRKIERKPMEYKFVFTSGAFPFSIRKYVYFFEFWAWYFSHFSLVICFTSW